MTPKPDSNELLGRVDIAPEVIQLIAGLAAQEVNGVAAIKGGVVGDLNQLLGRKNLRQGVKVELGEKIKIDIAVIVHSGQHLVEVGKQVQIQAKQKVEEMTGLTIDTVTVRIVGLKFPQKDNKQGNEKQRVK